MKRSDTVLHEEVAVVDALGPEESRLGWRYDCVDHLRKPNEEHFRDQFCYGVNETNRAEISDLHGPIFFG